MNRKNQDVELFGEKLILAERSVYDRRVTEAAFADVEVETFDTVTDKLANILHSGLKYNYVDYKGWWRPVFNFKAWQRNKQIKKLVSLKNILSLPYSIIEDNVWIMLAWEGIEKPDPAVKPKTQKKKH